MSKQIAFAVLILLISILSGCQSQPQETGELEKVKQQLTAIESRLDELEKNSSQTEHAPETTSTEMTSAQDQMFQITVTTYLLDTVGFHDLDESINKESTIQPQFLGMVRHSQRLVAMTAWPEDLQEEVKTFQDTLESYAVALENDNVDAAKPLATQAHDQQHDLSHAVGEWLAGVSGKTEPGAEGEHDHQEE